MYSMLIACNSLYPCQIKKELTTTHANKVSKVYNTLFPASTTLHPNL